MRPLLVGEANPYGADPDFALYPAPQRSAGYRLATQILGLSRSQYLDTFDRVNLCPMEWSMKVARRRADELCQSDYEVFVLLGAKVTSAFLPGKWEPFRIEEHCSGTFVILPHPSGLSRGWDRPDSFTLARLLLAKAGILLPREYETTTRRR